VETRALSSCEEDGSTDRARTSDPLINSPPGANLGNLLRRLALPIAIQRQSSISSKIPGLEL